MHTTRTIAAVTTGIALFAVIAFGPGCQDDGTGDPNGGVEIPPVSAMPIQTDAMDDVHKSQAQTMISDGLRFLLTQQEDSGGWRTTTPVGAAYTGLIVKALLQHPDFTTETPSVKRGLDYLMSFRQDDGGLYDPKNPNYANYTSSIALMTFAATQNEKYSEVTRELIGYLKDRQIVAGSKDPKGRTVAEGEDIIGGMSYGKHGRPDGSNVGMAIEALHQAGVPDDDPVMQRAMGFFTRLQNRSESNTTVHAKDGPNDGGFYYAIGESKAGAGPDGKGLRSYGSLTYMGFKSMLYAGLTKEDPRVRDAFQWIRTYWTLENNPNMPGDKSLMGLYYYYHTYAKALRAWGQPIIKDLDGVEHNWREELIDALAARVKDGQWVNQADRWYEGDPVLVTAYTVLAIEEATRK